MTTSRRSRVLVLVCAFIVAFTECHSLFDSQSSQIDKITEALRNLQKDNIELRQRLQRNTERLDETTEKLDNMYDENSELKENLRETKQTVSHLVLIVLGSKDLGEAAKDLAENDDVIRREVLSTDEKVDYGDLLSKLPPSVLLSLRGRDGRDGATGVQGPPGAPGRDGAQGPQGPPGKLAAVSINIKKSGAVYTRWGRTTCEKGSKLLYKGFAAGSFHTNSGGRANYQCLPLVPEYNKYGNNGEVSSIISGVEYQTGKGSVSIFPTQTFESNAPCARCYTEERSAIMMLPAKRTCPAGWTKEYEGYLMTERNEHHRATYECVDANPEPVPGSAASYDGALFYFVKHSCSGGGNTHHCPPYHADRELTCVICSK